MRPTGEVADRQTVPVSVVVPTLGREQVLVDSLQALLACDPQPHELIVVDQTPRHDEQTEQYLRNRSGTGRLRWLRLEKPSIPRAMNIGLQAARSSIVLFVDDDVQPAGDLLAAHARAHVEFPEAWAVAGQVLQPGESPAGRGPRTGRQGILADLDFPFWSNERGFVANVMAGNLSVKRNRALSVGAFDENFEGVAFRFETEFARRVVHLGGQILFEPAASLRHLRASRGGTRFLGNHATSASPLCGMGDYYFAMQSGWNLGTVSYMLRRPLREVATKFHLRHPWYIPVKLFGEWRSFWRGLSRWSRGPQLPRISQEDAGVLAEEINCVAENRLEINIDETKCLKS
jgi:GT2 family glycosyltransferase